MEQRPALIMIVDDEAHIVHVVTMKLQNAGYQVISAEDGEEALELATRRQPAAIITDYQMPFMNGLELCIRLKQQPTTQHIPCLMLTARGYSLDEEQMRLTNIVAMMSKPFSPREILARVQELVGHRQPDTQEQPLNP